MSLEPGARLGPYEIVDQLGMGGMGEVYRARDTRLDRTVAIKILQQHLSSTPEGRARFEREARAVSSLNHPNICVLHDVGREGDTDFIVMEHLDGESLAARLERGPLAPAEFLRLAMQIADALDKAHRQGIVHRDLKPGNVMLTSTGAKLLDFGLARSSAATSPVAALTMAPTLSRPVTAEGMLMGTFQYMAPELLEGREADARSDIFAFGAMLYEMATGRRPFEGRSNASVIAAILEKDPEPMQRSHPLTPDALERLVRSCLAKDPEERRHSAHDIRLELKAIAEAPPPAPAAFVADATPAAAPGRGVVRNLVPWLVALCVAAGAFAAGRLTGRAPAAPVIRFTIPAPSAAVEMGDPRVSPDGNAIAFLAADSSGTRRIWVRTFDALEARPLMGTEGAARPFWSPDSRYVAYMQEGKLRKMLATGGPAQTIAETGSRGDGSWSRRGMILFDSSVNDSILGVPAGGGIASPVLPMDHGRGETGNAWPQFLPDGRRFLFLGLTPKGEETAIRLGEIGGKDSRVLAVGSFSRMEYANPGYILFARDRALLAQAFDAGKGTIMGEPVPVIDDVGGTGANNNAAFSVSENGVLVYRPGSSTSESELVWCDRAGVQGPRVGTRAEMGTVVFSPDGTRAAVDVAGIGGTADIWIIDLARNISTRFTSSPADEFLPVWSPDGRDIYYASTGAGAPRVCRRAASGTGGEAEVFTGGSATFPMSFSPDGRRLLLLRFNGGNRWDLEALPMDGGKPAPFVASEFDERDPQFSPDGMWVAYASNESGRFEIYLQPFPGPGGKVRVSADGGRLPQWRADGRELYFLSLAGKMMAVDIGAGASPSPGVPHPLFDALVPDSDAGVGGYAVSADGKRFLVRKPAHARIVPATTVVMNWTALLGRK